MTEEVAEVTYFVYKLCRIVCSNDVVRVPSANDAGYGKNAELRNA